MKNKKPGRHRPRGLEILYEDRDLLVVNKEPGVLTTATRRGETFTAEEVLSDYLRKGCARSTKRVFLVHRLDRETSGVLLFAKSGEAQQRLKEAWPTTEKFYLAVVRGRMSVPQAVLTSYLAERDDLFVVPVADPSQGKRSQTAYTVIKATPALTFVKIRLLTGRRNQIRVQFAEQGHPVLGDPKYGFRDPFRERLCLHAKSIAFTHPHSGRRMAFGTPVPPLFARLAGGLTEEEWAAANEIC
ncbi:MAG: RluA family pseudouridine synthase [Kiritimatiellia bacterium]|jgi:tRNA pseudouridine32 synthase/23S rRNA pseudouridine746 synthase/23S rRNA pseudouridine1911/1915/1917 synthase|nr:RluA family pseudouridine synthase [Kiritimatiellia bacterium]